MKNKTQLAEVQQLQKIAGLLRMNESYDWTWTSTRTDQPRNSAQSKPESPVKKFSDRNNNLRISDILQNRLQNTKNHVLYFAKSYFEDYDFDKKNYEKSGKNHDLQSLKKSLINSIETNIQEYFFDKLQRKYNISPSNPEQYFQEIPSMVDKITSGLPNDPTPEQVAKLWPEFRGMLNQMFKQYEKLTK